MKKMKKTWVMLAALLMLTLLLANVLAITGSIGNARMVLRLQTGEEIEKYVLIKNVNQEEISINLTVSGDLEKYVTLKENNFKIKVGEEKKAYFTIVSPNPGTTETKINIAFIPNEGSGVGLSSTVVVIAEGEAVKEDTTGGKILGWLTGNKNNSSNETIKNNSSISGAFASISYVEIGLLSTTVILAIFIILLIIYSRKVKKKKEIKLKKNVKNIE